MISRLNQVYLRSLDRLKWRKLVLNLELLMGHVFNARFANSAKNMSPLLFKSVKKACSAARPLMEKVLEACLLIAEATIYSQQQSSLLQVLCASKRYLS